MKIYEFIGSCMNEACAKCSRNDYSPFVCDEFRLIKESLTKAYGIDFDFAYLLGFMSLELSDLVEVNDEAY